MLRARRNSNLAESLGPPLRFTDIEVSRTVEEKVVHRPSASSRRPPISVTRANQGKENKFRETPRGKPPTGANRQTPNSTYPASLGGNSGSIKKPASLGGQTPSSTFPVSLPITAPNSQDVVGITEPDSTSQAAEIHKNGTPSTVGEEKHSIPKYQPTAAAETNNQGGTLDAREETYNNPKNQPTTGTETNHQRGTLTTREELPSSMSYQSVIHRSNSIPKLLVNQNGTCTDEGHLSTQRNVLPSKLNLDQAMNKRGSEDAGIPVPLPSVAPSLQMFDHDPDMVTMVSTAGEKRFKRLKLLGCGGSSKVGTACSML